MHVKWDRDGGLLWYELPDGSKVEIHVVSPVRNETNGLRSLDSKPVYTEGANGSKGRPYMPRPFPKGDWNIVAVLPKTDPYEAPAFISTDAHQAMPVWRLKADGTYDAATEELVQDYGYGIHDSTSNTTLGCGRILGTVASDAAPGAHDTNEGRAFRAAVIAALASGSVPLHVM